MTFDTAKLGTVERDVTYCTIDDQALKLDLYYPPTEGPWPVLIFVHGGAWSAGDKSALPVNPAEAGYLVASLDYRLYPAHRFPAMIEDVKCAIRYLRAHASAYALDPERIALVGHSAGGHLVALAGLADESTGWDVGPYLDQSSRVQAVIPMAAPTDLTRPYPAEIEELLDGVFGPEQRACAGPVNHVRPDAPPFMIIQGEEDTLVPVEQAHLLHEALMNVGAPSELIVMEHAGHGFEPVGGTPTPSMDQILAMMLTFLSKMSVSPPAR